MEVSYNHDSKLSSCMVAVLATICSQVYPSEYAYHSNSVYRTERSNANCRNYSVSSTFIWSEDYIHCDSTPLRLTDSDIGSEQYTPSDYYVWLSDETRNHQLLFIFPTRVNLTTITLHYYSDSIRGLPRLRFWAVPDDFDVWDAPASIYSFAEVASVPPGGEPSGQRNVSISALFVGTMKILMHKYSSTFSFALSEVEFFQQCNGEPLLYIQ